MAATAREVAQRTQKHITPEEPPAPALSSTLNTDTAAAYPEFVSAGTVTVSSLLQQNPRVEEVNEEDEDNDDGREGQLAEDAAHIEALTQREIAAERADDAAVEDFLARRRDASEAVRERALRALTDAPPAKRVRPTLPIVVRRSNSVLEGYDDVVSSDDESTGSVQEDKED